MSGVVWRLVGNNIRFDSKWPMRGGKFPAGHPCSDDPKPTVMAAYRRRAPGESEWRVVPGVQPESATSLGRFRARGYWASCFPEGDGITFEPLLEQSRQQAAKDVAECFGVDVFE